MKYKEHRELVRFLTSKKWTLQNETLNSLLNQNNVIHQEKSKEDKKEPSVVKSAKKMDYNVSRRPLKKGQAIHEKALNEWKIYRRSILKENGVIRGRLSGCFLTCLLLRNYNFWMLYKSSEKLKWSAIPRSAQVDKNLVFVLCLLVK